MFEFSQSELSPDSNVERWNMGLQWVGIPLQVDVPKRDLGGPLLQLLLHDGGGLEEERESDRGGLGRHQQTGRHRCWIRMMYLFNTVVEVKCSQGLNKVSRVNEFDLIRLFPVPLIFFLATLSRTSNVSVQADAAQRSTLHDAIPARRRCLQVSSL